MAQLYNPALSITFVAGTDYVDCTASVAVDLTAFELFLVNFDAIELELQCQLWGEDGGLNGSDNQLVNFTAKGQVAEGVFTFNSLFHRDQLDEDIFGEDEVYAQFTLVSLEEIFQQKLEVTASTPHISGDF